MSDITLIFSILILVSKRNIVFKFELIPIIIILLSLSIVSVYLNLNNQTSQDLIDPVRLIIPILLFILIGFFKTKPKTTIWEL